MKPPPIRALSISLAIFTVSLALACAEPERDEPSVQDRLARIERIENGMIPAVVVRGEEPQRRSLPELMEENGVPAVSVAVINKGKLEWARAWGAKREGGGPVDAHTLFLAGQISQGVAAIGAMAMAEEGDLDLNAEVNGLLRSWRLPESEWAGPVTVTRILAHDAGLTVPFSLGYLPGEGLPDLLQILDGAPPATNAPVEMTDPASGGPRYSIGGYVILQLLMEELAGRPYNDLIYDLALHPLGMETSHHLQPLPDDLAELAAVGHEPDGEPVQGGWRVYPELAAGGMWTTPSDLARMVIGLHQALAGSPTAPLSTALARAIVAEHAPGRGLGFEVGGEGEWRYVRLEGHGNNFLSDLFAYAEKGMGAVVMTNASQGETITNYVMRAVAVEYGWPHRLPEVVDLVPLPPAGRQELVGRYRAGGQTEWRIRTEGDRLLLDTEYQGAVSTKELFPIGEGIFVELAFGLRYRVERETDGSVTGLTLILNDRELYTVERVG